MYCVDKAYAKINLTLDVIGKRDNGYHELETIMCSVGLFDTVSVETETGKPHAITSNIDYVPCDDNNIALKAVKLFERETGIITGGVKIKLEKNIPVCAGLAGGSTDGAAVLRLLNKMTKADISVTDLAELSRKLGADVPYCVTGGTVIATGIGDIISRLDNVPKMNILLCKPNFSISTPQAYAALDKEKIKLHPDTRGMLEAVSKGDIVGIATRLYNVFEPVEADNHRELTFIRNKMLDYGAIGASLSGSGSTMFGIYKTVENCDSAAVELKKIYKDVYSVTTIGGNADEL